MSKTATNVIDNRADYLRQLTNSLAASSSGNKQLHEDDQSLGDTSTFLQKFGQESLAGISLTPNHSITGSLDAGFRTNVRANTSGKVLRNSFAALGNHQRANTTTGKETSADGFNPELSRSDVLERDLMSSMGDDPHMMYLVNKEKGKMRNPKLVSGSQFRLTTRPGTHQHCGQCEMMDRLNKKAKETIRTLKLELSRMEERCHDLKRTKASDVAQQIAMKSSLELAQSSNEDLDFFSKKCDALEDEMIKLKKILAFERNANEGLRHALDETKTSLKREIADLQDENGRLQLELQSARSESSRSKQQLADLNNNLVQYKQQLEKAENKLSDCMLRLSNQKSAADDIGQLRELQRLNALVADHDNAQRMMSAQLRQKETELSQTQERLQVVELSVASHIEEKSDLQAQLSRSQVELKTALETLHATKKRCDVLEGTVKSTIEQRQSVQTQLHQTESNLSSARYTIREMEKDVGHLNSRVDDLLRRLSVEGENARKAIEKAISGSVRLCVVAPTVNVQVAESKKLKFKSEASKEQLKKFLDDEVLQKYSFLYKQKSDNAAPHGGSMEDWLQKMLAHMQTSIEQHVNSAMDGSSL